MKKGAYNETDILRIVEARHGKKAAAEIARKLDTVAYKGFDIPLPDVVGYHQHNSECASDAIQEILMFADGIREYTQPILYGMTPEQIEVRSKIVLEFAQWERFSDYLTYIQKRFRSHYDVINYLRLHNIKPQNYYSKEAEVCELDPIFRRKKRESAEGGILALKKLKREYIYTEQGMTSPLMKTTMESLMKLFGIPYTILPHKDIVSPNAVGSTIVSTVSYANGDGSVKTNTLRHATGFLKMLGEWYYYDNEDGIVKADKAIIEAFAAGDLHILTYKQIHFAKGKDNVITSVYKDGKWVSPQEAKLANAEGHLHKGIMILKTVIPDTGNCVFAALPESEREKYHGKCKVNKKAKNSAEFVETIQKFKECIYSNQDSNSLIFEDMYRYAYENIQYIRDDPETFDVLRKSSIDVLRRSVCTPMIHYWSYKIGTHLKELAANGYEWFEIPKLNDRKPRTPHNTPEFTRKMREQLKKQDEEMRKLIEDAEALKKNPCPPGQVRDLKTKECRDKKKPTRKTKEKEKEKNTNANTNNKTKKKKRSPCPPGQVRDTKTKECRDRGQKPCPEGQVRDPRTKECREPKKLVF
jgi:hypothetical protein